MPASFILLLMCALRGSRSSSLFSFASRSRHTRCGGDWSSDVCSSDLELDRPVETGVAPERAADVQTDHECRPGRLGPLRRRARHDAQRERECRDATPHDAPPSTVWVLPVAKIGVLWSTWSSDRNGRLKCGLPMITTTKKLNPLATSCSTGKVSSSIRCWASFLHHPCAGLS